MTDVERLKKLVFDGGFDAESKAHVLELERKIKDAFYKEKLSENPVIQEYTKYLASQVNRAEVLLKTDKSLTNEQRFELYAIIEVANKFHTIVVGEPIKDIEAEIKLLLDVASNQ